MSSVLVEATVQDEDGRYVSWLGKDDFALTEDGVPQGLDLVQLQDIPTTFTLLIDSSQSLNRRMNMVKAAAQRLATELRKGDRVIVAPFRTAVESTTGPTDDAPDHRRGDRRDSFAGRHRDPRRADHPARDVQCGRGPPRRHPADRRLRREQHHRLRHGHPGAAEAAGHRLRRRHRRGRRHLAQGRDAAAPDRQADGRAGLLPDPRGPAAQRPRHRRRRRLPPLSHQLHAEEPGSRRHLPHDSAGRQRAALPHPDPRGLLRPQAAAGQADDRVRRARRRPRPP